jgi:transcriptional regulator with XRE-family HTH domain
MHPKVKPMAGRLKKLRQARGLSQQALARKARLSREHLAMIESGAHDPRLGTVLRLAAALKVTLVELVK